MTNREISLMAIQKALEAAAEIARATGEKDIEEAIRDQLVSVRNVERAHIRGLAAAGVQHLRKSHSA